MIGAVLSALLSHWRYRPFQALTLVLGLSLATALWIGVQAINAEARKSYRTAAGILGAERVSLVDPTGAPIPPETFARLRRGGWLVSPVIEGWINAGQGRVRLLGVDPATLSRDTPAAAAIGTLEATAFLGPDGLVLAAPATAARLRGLGPRVRAVEGLAPGVAVADIAAARRLLGTDGFTRLDLAPRQPLRQTPLADLAPGHEREVPDAAADLARLTDSFHLNLTAFGLLSFVVGLFIANGAVGLAFEQRRATFRTLRALGVTAPALVAILCIELLSVALAAGTIGIGLGYVIAASLLPDVAATLRGLYGATVEGTLTLSPAWWVSGLGIAAFGTALAAGAHLSRTARLGPLAPARPRAWALADAHAMRRQLAASAICLLVALAAPALAGGLVAGFALLGGLLLAAALALPSALASVVGLAGRSAKSALSEWFWADTRQQLPGLSLALMALLLALSANIGVGTMVGSFRQTFTGWLDQRLVSELYVTAEDEAQIPGLLAFLEPRVDAVLPIWHAEADILGAPAEVYGIVDHSSYRENWPLLAALPDTWDRFAAGEGALVNEQLARREHLSPGDVLSMPGRWQTTILGTYSDYGNPRGQVILPLPVLLDRFDRIDRLDFGLRLPADRVADLQQALVAEFGLPPGNIVDQASLKAFSLDIFERTFAVTAALNVLTLGVAGVAILTSLLTLSSMRLPQLAPVWAIGLSRARLARIELLRTLALAALTFLIALPLGLVLAWVLLAVVNVEAFGWRLPMRLFPADWLWLGTLSLLAAGFAGLWPARRLAARPPADLLKVFAHER